MSFIAIDPGPVQSAYLLFNPVTKLPVAWGTKPNSEILSLCYSGDKILAIEMIASYGMAVGREVFETCLWIGRFIQQAAVNGTDSMLVYRREVKMHLCGSAAAKDGNIRQALIDIYGPGKDVAIGKKASPGPLYGMSGDVWAALAVARTFADTRLPKAI